MINLFEYQNKEVFEGDFSELETFLDDIWLKREKSGFYYTAEQDRIESQRFLQFLHKTNEIKSNKYIGVIHFEGRKINLLPKILHNQNEKCTDENVQAAHLHVLWWLSYCRKVKFPNYQTSLGNTKSDFFEILIYLFSKYTRELLSNTIYQHYEEEQRELSFIKGRILTSEYITENLAKGRWHKINCAYDAFVIDNQFNRIIKQVTTMLFQTTENWENKKHLREILFILDEVSDIQATADECANIQFNPMFSCFETVRDYCTLFLRNCVSFSYKNDMKLFAFLLPMEYVFEDFIYGFIDKEIDEIQAKSQDSSTYLDKEKVYALKPDLLLKIDGRRIITDTKYKMVYADQNDLKNGISQTDIYQMLAYGVRFKINDIVLLYPDTVKREALQQSSIIVRDEFTDDVEVNIKVYQVPVIQRALLNDYTLAENRTISEIFEETKLALIDRIREIYINL
ncbi:MAG: hypothetical protein IPO92_18805 [Saprospiraceae bacterium]|nr:hypothetical protein [Saprospiraceae bacterium]